MVLLSIQPFSFISNKYVMLIIIFFLLQIELPAHDRLLIDWTLLLTPFNCPALTYATFILSTGKGSFFLNRYFFTQLSYPTTVLLPQLIPSEMAMAYHNFKL